MLDPACARAGLAYRWNRQDRAHEKAEECGTDNHASSGAPHRGPLSNLSSFALMFPWESALTGAEVQFDKGTIGPWGKFEQHISGDVALAARQYWYATGDKEWLQNVGYPLARGVADFYAQRATSAVNSSYSFDGVMGPDEYNWPVNNSAYTNAIVRIALDFATESANTLGVPPDPLWSTVARGLSVATSIVVPDHPSLKGGYHPEFDGFEPVVTSKTPHPVKQADTIMLIYPLGFREGDALTFANDLTVYDPLTDPNGPAMTWSVFAIGWMSVKNYTRAAELFQRGYVNNVNPPFNVWSEGPHGTQTINFITGAGGFLQSALFGATGMRIRSPCSLDFDPPPPNITGVKSVTSIGARGVHLCGFRFQVDIDEEMMVFKVLENRTDEASLVLNIPNGKITRLRKVGDAVRAPRSEASLTVIDN